MSFLTVLINGRQSDQLSALDRGLLYGQSVFETITVIANKACLLEHHMNRLVRGCKALSIPLNTDQLRQEIGTIIQDQSKTVLRVTISMGVGGRGYMNPLKPEPCRILSLHPFPDHPSKYWQEGIELGIAEIRLAQQPALAGIKHGNRLEQIIARSQWQKDWQEALLLDQSDHVIEATQSNIFILRDAELLTPRLDVAGVEGVMREFVISSAHNLGLSVKTVPLSVDNIEAADEVFLTNSVIGLWPVRKFKNTVYQNQKTSHKLLNLMIKNEVIPDYKT